MKILIVGSINMDLVTYMPHLPKRGETSFGTDFMKNPGGKGANQACAAALLNANVTMLGSVGSDVFGKELISCLKKNNVKPQIKTSSMPTGCATILLEEDVHDNRIIVIPGANYDIKKEDIDKNIDLIKEADIILSQLEIPFDTVDYLSSKAKEFNKIFILNPAPGRALTDQLLRNIDYLTPNETELSLISKIDIKDEDSFRKACSSLLDKGVKTLLVTLGDKGVYLYSKEEEKLLPAYKVKAVDTTAAGDCFNGAFAAALTKGYPLKKAILYAEKASSIAVTRKGAISSLPKEEEVEAD